MPEFEGTLTALVTPFTPDSAEVDFKSLGTLIDYQLASHVQGFVVCGSTGEASTLKRDEYRQVLAYVRNYVNGKALCVAGVGVSSTALAQEMATAARELHYDGVLLSATPYNKPSQEGLTAHFRAVRQTCQLPIIAYNIPGRTSVNILPATLAAWARDGIIAAVKESSGSMEQVMDLLFATEAGRLPVLSGEDALVLACMACGGAGVISATANIVPQGFVNLTTAAKAGDFATARSEQMKLLPVVRAMFLETNPVPVKAALKLRGIIASDVPRLPLLPAGEKSRDKIRESLGF